MINKTLAKYLSQSYLKTILTVVFGFCCLSILLNLLDEISFFKDHQYSNVFFPLIMSFLKIPEILFSLFPFIILISAIFSFLQLMRNNEIIPIKVAGLSNWSIISLLATITFVIGVFIIVGFTPITAVFTGKYLEIKSDYTKNADHLAAITINGIWIKEKKQNTVRLIRASELKEDKLRNVSIYQFDEASNLIFRIEANSADIKSKTWDLNDVTIIKSDDNSVTNIEKAIYESAYDVDGIKNIYTNVNTVSFWKIKDIIKLYEKRGYSTLEYRTLFHRSLAFPFFLLSMVLLAAVGTLSVNYRGNYFYYVIYSIFACVFVYYFNDFSKALGQTGRLPIIVSIWMPIIVIFIFSSIGLLRVQQK